MIPFNAQVNHVAIRRKKIYDGLSDDKKEKIKQLSNCSWKEIKPVIIKRDKNYPEIGDIFEYKPNKEITLYGLVINNHIFYKGGSEEDGGWIVSVIFKKDIDIYSCIKKGIRKEHLLIYPNKSSALHWKKGYCHKITHVQCFKMKDSYGFDNPSYGRFETENGNVLKKEPVMFDGCGILTEFGFAYEILYQLIIEGVEFDLPIN